MESYGELLKKTRKEKYLDFDTVSRETFISRDYIEALEDEKETAFPGESYLKGFLKNYAEYLGLNSERILQLYKSKALQESPVPLELTKKEHPKFLIPLIVSILSAILLAGAIVAIITINKRISNAKAEEAIKNAYVPKKYELTEAPLKEKLFVNDELVLGTKDGNIILKVAKTDGKFGLETPAAGIQMLELSETAELDVDGDGKAELIAYVEDLSTNGIDRGAQVDIRLKSAENVAIQSPDENSIMSTQQLSSEKKWIEILSDNRAYPFVLNATIRSETMFRYKMIPGSEPMNESFYASGEQLSLNVRNGIRIGIANGTSIGITIQANSRKYEKVFNNQDNFPGKNGEIVVKDIKWVKDTDGRYKLVVIDID